MSSVKRPIRAITVYPPWSSLIASPDSDPWPKRTENRTWEPGRAGLRVGDFLAIHAGGFRPGRSGTADEWGAALELAEAAGIVDEVPLLREYLKVVDVPREEQGRFYRARCEGHIKKSVPYGAVVAVAVHADIVRSAPTVNGRPDPWFVGPVGWVLDEVVAIEPVPCKGAQGVWALSEEQLALVRARYKAALAGPTVPAP